MMIGPPPDNVVPPFIPALWRRMIAFRTAPCPACRHNMSIAEKTLAFRSATRSRPSWTGQSQCRRGITPGCRQSAHTGGRGRTRVFHKHSSGLHSRLSVRFAIASPYRRENLSTAHAATQCGRKIVTAFFISALLRFFPAKISIMRPWRSPASIRARCGFA